MVVIRVEVQTWGFPGASDFKKFACKAEDQIQSLGVEDPLEKEETTHFSILAWRISRTEEPGGLQFMRSAKSQTQLKN